jgi:hypothetical protein
VPTLRPDIITTTDIITAPPLRHPVALLAAEPVPIRRLTETSGSMTDEGVSF